MTSKSTIATDHASPHYGHHVSDLGEGRWICVTCDPLNAIETWAETLAAATDRLVEEVEALQAAVARTTTLVNALADSKGARRE